MEILHSDSDIVICIKPVGLDSEHEVPSALKEQLGGEIFTLHRLDKNVGGVMAYARNKAAAGKLSAAIETAASSRNMWRRYTAHLPSRAIGRIGCLRTAGKTRSLWSSGNEPA